MTTVSFRQVDAGGERLGVASGPCALGTLMLATGARGVVAIVMGDDAQALWQDLQARFPRAALVRDDPQTREYLHRATAFIEGTSAQVDFPLDIRGTAFQRQVWAALRTIPPGTTVTYAELARRTGAPAAVRAVAGACGANALAVVIPCHRVVRSDGTLSGYRWGVARKQALITREAACGAGVAQPA